MRRYYCHKREERKMKRKSVGWLIGCVLAFLGVFCISISADQPDTWKTMPKEYGEMVEAFPDELRDSLSDELLSQDAEVAGAALGELLSNLLVGFLTDFRCFHDHSP